MVALKEAKTFLNAVRNTTGSVATANDSDLMNYYRMFVANLETLFIKSCKKFDSWILNSKEIIQSILKKENIALFRKVKKHFDSSRQPTEQHFLDEMIIAVNGPLLHHADEMLERAINQYWRVANRDTTWHFLLQTEDIHSYTRNCSKVAGKLLDQKSNLPSM